MTRRQGLLVICSCSIAYFFIKYELFGRSASKFDIPAIASLIYAAPFILFLIVAYKLVTLSGRPISLFTKGLQYAVVAILFFIALQLIVFLYELDGDGNPVRDYFYLFGDRADAEFRVEYLLVMLIIFGILIKRWIGWFRSDENEHLEP